MTLTKRKAPSTQSRDASANRPELIPTAAKKQRTATGSKKQAAAAALASEDEAEAEATPEKEQDDMEQIG